MPLVLGLSLYLSKSPSLLVRYNRTPHATVRMDCLRFELTGDFPVLRHPLLAHLKFSLDQFCTWLKPAGTTGPKKILKAVTNYWFII